jgi:hypothetical protein
MRRQLFQHHPVFGYHFVPGLKTRIDHENGGYLVRVNESGFRNDREFEETKDPAVFRILLFGDSYTAGDAVSNKDRYGDVLERSIPGVEVYNFALSGSGTDQQYLVFRHFAPRIEHDLVIAAVLVENIRRVVARYRPFYRDLRDADDDSRKVVLAAKPYFELQLDGRPELRGVPVPKEPIRLDELPQGERAFVHNGGGTFRYQTLADRLLGPRVKNVARTVTRYQPVPGYARSDHPDWLLLRAILAGWIAESAAPVLVMPIPLRHHVEGKASAKQYRCRFRELERDTGAIVHDPLPDLQRYSPKERRAFRHVNDVHLTPFGHRALAESLIEAVRPLVSDRSGARA